MVDFLCKNGSKFEFGGYVEATIQNLDELVDFVVDIERNNRGKIIKKAERHGIANVNSVKKVLDIWKGKDIISAEKHDSLVSFLDSLTEQYF